MGANATTSVPTYVAGEVLTAADLNVTNSGIPVFADSTARTNSFGGTGEKTLAEGQYAYLEDDNKTYVYDGAAWQEVGGSGLVLISSTTIGSAVSSVTVSNAFSSTYENYKVIISGGVASTTVSFFFTLGASTANYYYGIIGRSFGNATVGDAGSNVGFMVGGFGTTVGLSGTFDVCGPQLARRTYLYGGGVQMVSTSAFYTIAGYHDVATAYTDFTITTNTGTITGGTIKVYGYRN